MYFQRPGRTGTAVSKIASSVLGESTANRLLTGACANGAGASASSSALVTVKTPRVPVKTMRLRCEFFTLLTHRKETAGDAVVKSRSCRPRLIKPATRICPQGTSGKGRENVQRKAG